MTVGSTTEAADLSVARTDGIVRLGGLSLGAILSVLVLIGINDADVVAPTLQEMVRSADLYHVWIPVLVTLPPVTFAVLAWAVVVCLWLVYLWLIWQLRGRYVDARLVTAGAIGLALVALIVPPLFTTDLFSYAIFGRLVSVYNVNPYVTTARQAAPADVLMPYLYWRDIPSPYGPLWTIISAFVSHGVWVTPLDLVIRFKLISIGAALIDGQLIFRLAARRCPEQAGWAYLAFAWNPMVLVEGMVLGHNDVVILLLLVGAAALLGLARPTSAVLGLTGSALIKYSTVPLLGAALTRALFRSCRPTLQRFAVPAVAALTLVVISFLPFWVGVQDLASTMAEPGRGLNNPLMIALSWLLGEATGGRVPGGVPVAVVLGAVLFGGWQLIDLWRDRVLRSVWTIQDELAAWSRTLSVFLLFWPRIHTWYFLPPIGLALAAGPEHRRLFWAVLVLSIVSYVSYFR